MPTQSEARKDMKIIEDAVRKAGYTVVPRRGHKRIQTKAGHVVMAADGKPLILSSSPSDVRNRELTIDRLMKAQVLQKDPFKGEQQPGGRPEKKKDVRQNFRDPEAKAKSLATQQAQSRERAEKTQALRSRVEPIVVKLGGWENKGFMAELARTALAYVKSRGRVECWETESGAVQSARLLRMGSTLSDRTRIAWEVFFEELEKAEDPLARYMELVREAKGILQAQPETVEEGKVVQIKTGEPVPPPPSPAPPPIQPSYGPASLPTLALEVVYMMTVGREDPDHAKILELAQKVQMLELERR